MQVAWSKGQGQAMQQRRMHKYCSEGEDCALDMGQNSSDAAVTDAQIKLRREEYA